jgi:5-methylcytosine-specific restriction endonuclease McrA
MKRNYGDPVYKKWRTDILKRDKFKCRMPQCNSKSRLQVHHIRPWSSASSLRYETSNGITLCYNCHKSIKDQERHYEALFIEIINDK